MKNGINFIRNERCEFNVWAPFLSKVAVKIISPEEKVIPMEKDTEGYWKTTIAGITPAAKYFYLLGDEKDRADPATLPA